MINSIKFNHIYGYSISLLLGLSFAAIGTMQVLANDIMLANQNNYAGQLPEGSQQYNFMIGDWDITTTGFDAKGNITGTGKGIWWAEHMHGGRVVYENAVMINDDGSLEANMPAMRTYVPELDSWRSRHMFPLGGSDNYVCENVGKFKQGIMNLDSDCFKLTGELVDHARIRFFDIEQDSFSYTWESSKDNLNWTKHVLIHASRRDHNSVRPDQNTANYSGDIPEESAQFDFLLGHWKILSSKYDDKGNEISRNKGLWSAKPLHGGRAIHDDRVLFNNLGQQVPDKQTLRTYAKRIKRWSSLEVESLQDPGLCVDNQYWINDEMLGTKTCINRQGEALYFKKTLFSQITKNGFKYTEKISKDNKHWRLVRSIIASNK